MDMWDIEAGEILSNFFVLWNETALGLGVGFLYLITLGSAVN
jgi:hypothetical protein